MTNDIKVNQFTATPPHSLFIVFVATGVVALGFAISFDVPKKLVLETSSTKLSFQGIVQYYDHRRTSRID